MAGANNTAPARVSQKNRVRSTISVIISDLNMRLCYYLAMIETSSHLDAEPTEIEPERKRAEVAELERILADSEGVTPATDGATVQADRSGRTDAVTQSKPEWADDFTTMVSVRAIREGRYRDANERAPHGYYDKRPVLGRDSREVNGSIDLAGKVIVDDTIDPDLRGAGDDFMARLPDHPIDPARLIEMTYDYSRLRMHYDLNVVGRV